MADNPEKKGRDRDLVSEQEHEVAYLMRTAKVTRQKALRAIRGRAKPRKGDRVSRQAMTRNQQEGRRFSRIPRARQGRSKSPRRIPAPRDFEIS